MFTGLVEECGKVKSISQSGSSLVLDVECSFAKELALGESVAVNGVCLTVIEKSSSSFSADVTPETFRRTSLGSLINESFVNLERAMKADGRFGGHIVSGHIDGTGKIAGWTKEDNAVNVSVCVSENTGRYIIEKGSVAVDGISLTVASVEKSGSDCVFTVAVIPHTWANTTLCRKENGSVVNIECDVVGKYVERFVKLQSEKSFEDDKNNLENFMADFPSFH